MQILRNRELCRMLAVMLAVMAAGSVAGFCFDCRKDSRLAFTFSSSKKSV